jgi:hypothetical protein
MWTKWTVGDSRHGWTDGQFLCTTELISKIVLFFDVVLKNGEIDSAVDRR